MRNALLPHVLDPSPESWKAICELIDPSNQATDAQLLADASDAYTLLHDGRVIACAGVMELWQGRGMAWALLADNIGQAMIAVHRIVYRFLWKECTIRRVEAYVDQGFAAGHRWVHDLGFQREGMMRAFAQHGGDMVMWARVR